MHTSHTSTKRYRYDVPRLYLPNVYKRMVYIEGLFMPEHWCSLLISLSFTYSYNFMYTKGITFNSGFYFTTIAIYSCWLDTSSNKSFVFSTTRLVQREKIFTTLPTPSVSYERKLKTTSTTLLSRFSTLCYKHNKHDVDIDFDVVNCV